MNLTYWIGYFLIEKTTKKTKKIGCYFLGKIHFILRTYVLFRRVILGELYLKSILNSFLTIEQNKKLYEEYKVSFDKRKLDVLENEFEKFYSKIVLVSYFSKALHFAAQKYDQGIRRYKYFKEELLERNDDVICIDSYNVHEPEDIVNHIEDQNISESINDLTDRQKRILYLHFVKEMTEAEIASVLNISQQAVNKAKNKAIDEIRLNITK